MNKTFAGKLTQVNENRRFDSCCIAVSHLYGVNLKNIAHHRLMVFVIWMGTSQYNLNTLHIYVFL